MALPESQFPDSDRAAWQQRIWDSAWLECGLLLGLAFVLRSFPLALPATLRTPANLLTALMPALLWLGNSWWRGGHRPPVRRAALGCLLIAGLVCSAICLPLIEQVYEVQRWLPLESAINRIIGYSVTVGLTQATALWLVLRYAVPRRELQARTEVLVCGRAAAVGYATVSGLAHALEIYPTLSAQGFAVFNSTAALNCVGIILAYGLAELYFSRDFFLLLPAGMTVLAAFVSGSAIPMVAGFSNAGLSSLALVSSVSPQIGSLFYLGLLLSVWAVFRFLFANAGPETLSVARDDGAA